MKFLPVNLTKPNKKYIVHSILEKFKISTHEDDSYYYTALGDDYGKFEKSGYKNAIDAVCMFCFNSGIPVKEINTLSDLWRILLSDGSELTPDVSFTARNEENSTGPEYKVRAYVEERNGLYYGHGSTMDEAMHHLLCVLKSSQKNAIAVLPPNENA